MSIINDAIKKAGRDSELKNRYITKNPAKTDTPAPSPHFNPAASEFKWTVAVAISLAVIASLLGSLVLYKNMSDIKIETVSPVSIAGAGSSVSLAPTPKKRISPLTMPVNNISLNGIVYETTDRWAIINNRIVREGDRLPGATLSLIQKDLVEIVKDNGEKLVLELR